MITDITDKKYLLSFFYIVSGLFIFLWTRIILNADNLFISLVMPASILFIILFLINFETGLVFLILFSVLGSDFGFDIKGLPKLYAVELMLIFLSTYFAAKRLYTRDCSLAQNKVNRPIFVLLIWSIISIIGSRIIGTTEPSDLIHQINNVLLWLFAFLAFLIITNEVKQERTIKKYLYLIIASSVFYLAFYFLKLITIGRLTFGYENRVFSSSLGVFSGAYLMTIFILVLNHILYIKQYRFAMIALLACLLFALIETFWITSLVATTVAILTSISFRSKKFAIIIFLTFVIAFTYFAGIGKMRLSPYLEDFSYKTRQIEESPLIYGRLARLVVFKDSIRIIKEHPVFGVGMDMYGNYTDIKYLDRRLYEIRPMTSAHNEYLQVMVSVGVLGLPLFLWILYAAFKEASFLIKNTTDLFQKYLGRSLLNILIGVVIYSLSFQIILNTFGDGYFQSLSCSVYFWILLGLVVTSNNIIKQKKWRLITEKK